MAYTIEKRELGYLLFTINRIEKRNAINYEVMEGLTEAIRQAKESDIKALVITGAGDQAFCSGGDLSVFHLLEMKEDAYPMLSKMSNILYSLLTLPKPTVALVNGIALGGGCELASACDFRFARKGIKAGFVQGKQAITTGWGGGSIVAEKLSSGVAMELLMGAEIHTADYLKDIGFINNLFDDGPLLACETYLGNLLANDPLVLESYKNLWIRKWEVTKLHERMEEEVRNCASLWERDAHHNYVKKFISKKTGNKE